MSLAFAWRATAACTVRARSCAEIPVVTPSAASIETVKAVVVLRATHKDTTEQQIIDWCRENMAVYKVPRIVQFVPALPKSGSGKVMWRALQESELAAEAKA